MSTYAFGVVESRESRALRVRMYFGEPISMDATSTRNEPALRLRAALQPETGWYIIKVTYNSSSQMYVLDVEAKDAFWSACTTYSWFEFELY